MRRCYYLSNVKHDRFALEVPCLLPGYHGCRDLSNCTVVTTSFDVRVRPSSVDNHNRRRKRGAAATIAAWSVRDNGFGSEDKGGTELMELGRATFVEEQDCRLVQDLIKEANDLVSSVVSAALKRPAKFIASLYYEEEDDDSIVDIAFSKHHKDDEFDSDMDDDYNVLCDDHNPPLDNNKNIDAILADLAADTSRLFYSKREKI